MLRTIVFDVDGTLVDSVDLHARCWQEAFARYGRQVDFRKIRNQIGKGGDQRLSDGWRSFHQPGCKNPVKLHADGDSC